MQWPVSRKVHPDSIFPDTLQDVIAIVANTIAAFEPVMMLMDNRFAAKARQKLSSDVDIWDILSADLCAGMQGRYSSKMPIARLLSRT